MNILYNKFLIVFSIIMLLGGVYLYFSNELKSEAALFSSFSSSLEKEGEEISSDQKIASDISFISTLSSLKKIKIDITLFTNNSFKNLVDNTVKLEEPVSGRANPFSPIEMDSYGNVISPPDIITNNPLEIKSEGVIFSASVSNTNGVSSPYFEYGLTEKLGQKTSQTTLSSVGTFVFNVMGLTKKTAYFYKACAKFNGVVFCGNVISFNTN